MYARLTSFPRTECNRCFTTAWVECGGCGRWYCGPCRREQSGGTTACTYCHPTADPTPSEGGEP